MARTLTIKDIEAEGRDAEFWDGWTDADEATFQARMVEIDAEIAAERQA